MRPLKLLAALALVATTGCGQAASPAGASAPRAGTAVAALGKAAGKAMSPAQARALVAVLDKDGDGQIRQEEGHLTLLWGTHEYAENKGSILDPSKPFKPIPAALVAEKLAEAGTKLQLAGAIGYKDQAHVKMSKAEIARITEGLAQVLAQGPDVQGSRIPVRHETNYHYPLRKDKDELRRESLRWVAGTMADELANPNNKLTIESGGQHPEGGYQFHLYTYKVM